MTSTSIFALEAWHRAWEIRHPDKIKLPTFASEYDLNHQHLWFEYMSPRGDCLERCARCPLIRRKRS